MATARRIDSVVEGPSRLRLQRIDTWSVLKFSLLFYTSIAVVVLATTLILYYVASTVGVLSRIEGFVRSLGAEGWQLDTEPLVRALAVLGIVNVIFWSALTVCVSFLYNLVSAVVGGIEVMLSDRDL